MQRSLNSQIWYTRARQAVNFNMIYLNLVERVRSAVHSHIEEIVYSPLHVNYRVPISLAVEAFISSKI
jgi:hypothetical protein